MTTMRDIDTHATRKAIPADFPVQPVEDDDDTVNWANVATDGGCGLSWDDGKPTSYTPTPGARCPFEAFHTEGRFAHIEFHSEMSRDPHPAVNIKVNKGPESVVLPIELGRISNGGDLTPVFTDSAFTLAWVEAHLTDDADRNSWWETTCEDGFQQAREIAEDVFWAPVQVYSEGRSGGWLVVYGLGDPQEWTEEQVETWIQFAKDVRAIADDIPRAYLVSIYMNVFEPQREEAGTHAEAVAAGEDLHCVSLTTNQIKALAAGPIDPYIAGMLRTQLGSPDDTEPVQRLIALPDGEVRIWEPEAHANDLGRMYVLDVFGASLMIREREDGLYVHIDRDGESPNTSIEGPLHLEVAGGGENTYGE